MKRSIKTRNKNVVGIGGIKCPCCSPRPQEAKKQISRIERRRIKRVLAKLSDYASQPASNG